MKFLFFVSPPEAFSYTILFNESVSISPGTGFYRRDALITEALYTFMLAFVVLNVAYAEGTRGNQYTLSCGPFRAACRIRCANSPFFF